MIMYRERYAFYGEEPKIITEKEYKRLPFTYYVGDTFSEWLNEDYTASKIWEMSWAQKRKIKKAYYKQAMEWAVEDWERIEIE